MKKLFLIAVLLLAELFSAQAYVRNIRYVYTHNVYSTAIVDGVTIAPNQGVLLEQGSTMQGTWIPGCAPANGGGQMGTVATQQQDPVTGIWHTTSSFIIILDTGCESATWVFTVWNGAISDVEESPYCPCR